MMQCLTLIVHASAQQDLVDRIRVAPEVEGFTLIPCEGHSSATHSNPLETTRDRVVGYVPRVRVDIVLEDDEVERVLANLQAPEGGVAGMGMWFVTDVQKHGRM